ncbi:MAG: BspA family leucine-rich repeat surface protein, partial [Halomonas sp.]
IPDPGPAPEPDIDCFAPESVGQIGNSGPCDDMLIVDNTLLRAAASPSTVDSAPGGDGSFAIAHADSGRTFTFGDSDDNIFTGQATFFYGLFHSTDFNDNINYWDTRNVTTLNATFMNASLYNQPLDQWDVSSVTTLQSTFNGAREFNQPLNDWDVSRVTTLSSTFSGAHEFNQPLNNWDVSSVTTLRSAFSGAREFNQPLDQWDVSSVTSLDRTFQNTSEFNQPLDMWDVSRVTDMGGLFRNASAFDQPLAAWGYKLGNVTRFSSSTTLDNNNVNVRGIFSGATAFDQDISIWCTSAYQGENLPSGDLSNPDEIAGLVAFSGIADQPSKQPQWGSCP